MSESIEIPVSGMITDSLSGNSDTSPAAGGLVEHSVPEGWGRYIREELRLSKE